MANRLIRISTILLAMGITHFTSVKLAAATNTNAAPKAHLKAPPLRPIPQPLPHHPGNIFVEGEVVKIPVHSKASGKWQAFDVDGKIVASASTSNSSLSLGPLPVGFYRIKWDCGQSVTAAVLAPLIAPIPEDSPVCAHGWLGGCYILGIIDSIDDAVCLSALAGINSIRSSTAWSWHTDTDGQWTYSGSRKSEAFLQTLAAARKHGLRLLMLFEPSVPRKYALPLDWGTRSKGYPADLRDYARITRRLVKKAGKDVDWESWNEPDGIGGMQIGSEITTAMKVFALAAHSIYPKVYVGLGSANAGKRALTESMDKNGYLSAVDSYNFHSHSKSKFAKKCQAIAPFTGKRPVWCTEYSYGSYSLKPGRIELTQGEIRQAADIPKMFARGLHDGNERLYYFMPLDFGEVGKRKWGVLKSKTLQPRPGYLALAATGRFLAGAKPAGALSGLPEGFEGWIFQAKPDGRAKTVAILWKNNGKAVDWKPFTPVKAWDLWGRPINLSVDGKLLLGTKPVYCVFTQEDLKSWVHSSPPVRPVFKRPAPGALCPVVADFRQPERFKNREGDFFLFTQRAPQLDIDLYNFSTRPLSGHWKVEAPDGYVGHIIRQPDTLAPNDRKTLRVKLQPTRPWTSKSSTKPLWLRLVGDYGKAGKSILAIRFVNCPSNLKSSHMKLITGAMNPVKWRAIAAKGTTLKMTRDGGWMKFDIAVGPPPNRTIGTTWSAPLYKLSAKEKPSSHTWGMTLKLRCLKAPKGTAFSVNLIKRNGAAWNCTFPFDKQIYSTDGMRLTLPLSWFSHISYRLPDSSAKLLPEDIVGIEIVAISKPMTEIQLGISDMAWVYETNEKLNSPGMQRSP
jgi:hypothetical protein